MREERGRGSEEGRGKRMKRTVSSVQAFKREINLQTRLLTSAVVEQLHL